MLGCSGLTSGDDEPVAIEFINPPSTIEVNDTVVIGVRALNRGGDSIPGVRPVLISENPDTLGVTDDSTAIFGRVTGPGRLRASIGDLQTPVLPVTVTSP